MAMIIGEVEVYEVEPPKFNPSSGRPKVEPGRRIATFSVAGETLDMVRKAAKSRLQIILAGRPSAALSVGPERIDGRKRIVKLYATARAKQ